MTLPAPPSSPLRLLDLPVEQAAPALEAVLVDMGEPAFRARQILRQLYQRHVRDFERMTDLPSALRAKLAARVQLGLLALSHRSASSDGTVKYLWTLSDGREIESVALPWPDRLSCCISSQVGCALSCRFCATGKLGLGRNLTAGEMVDQVLAMREDLADKGLPETTSVVFMGQGEPGYNMNAVLAACRTLNAEAGVGIGARRMTISTSGVIPAIERLASEPMQVRLAVSLHQADQAKRVALMDIAARHPLGDLLAACRAYQHTTGRLVTFEYSVMPGINDSPADAQGLASFASQVPSKINLIPYNPVEGFEARASSEREVARFRTLVVQTYPGDVMVRQTRGRDIEAACGMLHKARADAPGQDASKS